MAKLATQRAAFDVADTCLQIHGGAGYMKEYDIERAARDARLGPIGGGTDEIMREILGQDDGAVSPAHRLGELDADMETVPTGRRVLAALGPKALNLGLPNYTNNFKREGFTDDDLADGGSDRLVDALVAHGDAEAIAARIAEHHEAGADHVALQVVTGGDRGAADSRVRSGASSQPRRARPAPERGYAASCSRARMRRPTSPPSAPRPAPRTVVSTMISASGSGTSATGPLAVTASAMTMPRPKRKPPARPRSAPSRGPG